MDFELPEDVRIMQKDFRAFCTKEIAPLVDEAEEEEKFPVELWRKMGKLGYLGLTVSPEYGGSGFGLLPATVVSEELSRINVGIATAFALPFLLLPVIEKFGTSEQKQRYLIPGAKGEAIMAIALTEPNAGSDLEAIETMAFKEGDTYVINGTKTFITNASISDWMLTLVYIDKAMKLNGTRLVFTEKETPGIGFTKLRKMCSRPSDTCEVSYENVRVPERNILGGDVSFRDTVGLFNSERVYLAARALGNAQAAFEASLKYAKERTAFGKSIASYQAIKFRLTSAAMNLEAGRLLTYKAAWLRDQGKPFVKEASMAKVFTSQAAERICLDAMHIHGGYGVMSDLPIQRYVRDIGTFQIGGGTTEMQHLRIAKEIGM